MLTHKPLLELTAADVMSQDGLTLEQAAPAGRLPVRREGPRRERGRLAVRAGQGRLPLPEQPPDDGGPPRLLLPAAAGRSRTRPAGVAPPAWRRNGQPANAPARTGAAAALRRAACHRRARRARHRVRHELLAALSEGDAEADE